MRIAYYPKRERAFSLRGFTLIELIVALAIISILSALVYPSYQQYVRKARRVDAAVKVLALAQQLERIFLQSLSYAEGANVKAEAAGYLISTAISANGASYVIYAKPKSTSDQSRDPCGTLVYEQTGRWQFVDGSQTVGCLVLE
ncbi:Type IV fimbrial biogenesis protein [gamma proteobacterium HdN1]|nr:Type IV fimbrial biogenesis protein [gamma proteobacterium HdN1]